MARKREPSTGNTNVAGKFARTALILILRILPWISLGYIGYLLSQSNIDWTLLATSPQLLATSLLVILLYLCSLIITAYNFFYALIHISGVPLNFRKILSVYINSNMYKYLPGNILHYVGRNSLTLSNNILHRDVASASLLEIIGNVLVICTISIAFGFKRVSYILALAHESSPGLFYSIITGICIIALIVLLLYYWFDQAKDIIHKLLSIKAAKIWVAAISVFAINYMINGVSFYLIVYALGFKGDTYQIALIFFAYNIAWLAGFVTPGAPGGIGIKEFVIVLLLGSNVSEPILLMSVILHRLCLIATDITAYFLNMVSK